MSKANNMSPQEMLKKIKLQEIEDSQIISLNANENQMSNLARSVLTSRISDRYNLGGPKEHKYAEIASLGNFLFKGLKHLYEIEKSVADITTSMFHAEASEFRLLSGIHGMLATLVTFTEPGDAVYSIDYSNGGHFATPFIIERMGRIPCSMPVNIKNFSIDLDRLSAQFKDQPPKMIYFDIGCPLFPVRVKEIRDIVGPEVVIVYDASHTLGLIAGGEFQNPLDEGADILQGNTHKTFPGPQKAMVNFKSRDYAQKFGNSLSHGLVSNRHNHHDLALFVTVLEMQKFGEEYAKQMLLNAQCLANNLREYDIDMLECDGEYTRSHILLIKGDSVGDYIETCQKLIMSNICVNSRYGFGAEVIRIGVQEVTRRGMKEDDMKTLASFFKKILKENVPIEKTKNEVIEFNKQFNSISFSFDKELGY